MQKRRRNKMSEPWGYLDENNYQSSDVIRENNLDEFFTSASYNKGDNKLHFKNKEGEDVSTINVSDFVKPDKVVEKAWYENGKIYIKFTNGDTITIDVEELVDSNEFKDGLQVNDGVVSVLIDQESDEYISVSNNGIKVSGVKTEIDGLNNKIDDETSARESADTTIENTISELSTSVDSKANSSDVYTKGEIDGKENALQGGINANSEAIALKADSNVVYTKEEVDAIVAEKDAEITKANNEIFTLKGVVGDIGGNVTYDLPGEGKSFNTLMGKNGTVKLSEDVETGRFGPGITAKNDVKLNLNTHNLTISGLTPSTTQSAIMSRGTQKITIYGKGTIDAGQGICVMANGADSEVNLTGSTTIYQTDRSGGELIYCYAGTINITNGTFKNNGEDKKFLLNCYDANYRNGTAKIIVTGGKFYDFNPADNTAEGEHTNFLAEGYHVETSTDGESTVYTVKKDS